MKKRIALCLAILLSLMCLAGCASKAAPASPAAGYAVMETAAYDMAVEAPAAAPEPYAEEAIVEEELKLEGGWDSNNTASPNNGGYGGHKIIKNASIGLETRDFDEDLAYIKQKAVDMQGYVSSSNVSGKKPTNYNDGGRYAHISLRIPQERMEVFLSDARGVATVTYESTSGEDITAAYFDTESRLSMYTTQRERILKLLDSAESMEDIIVLESELSRLTYEIESLTTQIGRWDDLINFATVNVELREIPPASAAASDDTVGTRIRHGFRDTLAGIAVFFEELLVFLIAASPVLIILAVVAVGIVLLVKHSRRKKQKKEKEKNEGSKSYFDEKNPKEK